MISIIVTAYNIEKYISKCLDSVLGQTFRDIEIIVVDDGSTDGSGSICDLFEKKDCRVKVVHKNNSGVVSARKTGFSHANGEYIGFVDGDDWIEPDMYERLYDKLTGENVDISMCGRFEDSQTRSKEVFHGIPEGRYDRQQMKEKVYPNMIASGGFFDWGIFPGYWDKLFRRKVLEEYLNGVDEHIVMGEDAACVFPCILNSESIYVLHKCLYHYRQTKGSMVHGIGMSTVKERERFVILYEYTLGVLSRDTDIYDVTRQWLYYVLFLMVPRADVLYNGLDELNYLFPYPQVKKGERVIVYGAGFFGQRIYEYLKHTEFCIPVAMADRDYERLSKTGIDVIAPKEINNYEFDAIIIAVSFQKTRDQIFRYLKQVINCKRIYVPDINEITSEKTLSAFGLE